MAWQPKPRRAAPQPLDEEQMPPRRKSAAVILATYALFHGAARGDYRIFNAAGYRFYRSTIAPPALGDVPFATHATLPYTPTATYADGTWYLSMSYFDGVLDSGFLPIGPRGETYLTLKISGGAGAAAAPSPADNVALSLVGGGVAQLVASYLSAGDGANAASIWAIAYTTSGSTPVAGSPTQTLPMQGSPMELLAFNLPAQTAGTTVKVLLQTYNGAAYSTASAVLSVVIPSSGPAVPLAIESWPGDVQEGA